MSLKLKYVIFSNISEKNVANIYETVFFLPSSEVNVNVFSKFVLLSTFLNLSTVLILAL